MRARNRKRWIGVLALPAVIGASLAAIAVSNASTSAECGSVDDGSIVESKQFTPVEARLTQPIDPPINASGEQSASVPADARVSSIDELPFRWAAANDDGAVYQYFLGTDLDGISVSEFYAAGGIQLDRDLADNGESFAEYVLGTLGERAVKVQIGDHTGALVWADPQVNGLRTHHLYWTDSQWNYALVADTSPEKLLSLGRDLVCGGRIGVQSGS